MLRMRRAARAAARARCRAGRPSRSVMPALSIATSVPVPIAMPTCGCGERRRVVDAVAGHGDDAAFALQLPNHLRLAFGSTSASILPIPSVRPRFGGGAAVAREHHDREPVRAGARQALRAPP